jgi:hypothetical protein
MPSSNKSTIGAWLALEFIDGSYPCVRQLCREIGHLRIVRRYDQNVVGTERPLTPLIVNPDGARTKQKKADEHCEAAPDLRPSSNALVPWRIHAHLIPCRSISHAGQFQ